MAGMVQGGFRVAGISTNHDASVAIAECGEMVLVLELERSLAPHTRWHSPMPHTIPTAGACHTVCCGFICRLFDMRHMSTDELSAREFGDVWDKATSRSN